MLSLKHTKKLILKKQPLLSKTYFVADNAFNKDSNALQCS